MDNIVEKCILEPKDLHQHVCLPFYIPKGIEHINVKVNNNGYPETKVNMMVYSPNGYRGMLDKDKHSFYIGDYDASYGMLAGEIESGQWQIVIDVARLKEKTEVEVTIMTTGIAKRWYRGDLHTHTIHSDGHHNLCEAAEIAIEEGLDFIALTDHNTYSQNVAMPLVEGFVFIPGVELTTGKGHVNLLGLSKPLDVFKYTSKEEVGAMLSEATAKGAYVSINHPYVGDRWRWGFENLSFHAIELWNGTDLSRNTEVIKWWQEQLCFGHKYYITGGSDVHCHGLKNRWYGKGQTIIYADSLQPNELIKGLLAGHNAVAASNTFSFADIHIGEAMMGDTFKVSNSRKILKLKIDMVLSETTLLCVFSNQGCILEKNYDGVDHVSEYLEVSAAAQFLRVELWQYDEDQSRCNPFFTNPIFIEVGDD